MKSTWLIEFLKTLEQEIAPPAGHHHMLRFSQYGNDSGGWEDHLCLCVVFSFGTQNYFLADEELEREPHEAAKLVAAYIRAFPGRA